MCKYCKGTGKYRLLNKLVDCDQCNTNDPTDPTDPVGSGFTELTAHMLDDFNKFNSACPADDEVPF